jgi:hypothetical protein
MTSLTLEEYKAYLKTNRNFWGIDWDDTSSSWPYFTHPQAKCTDIPFPNRAGEFAHLAVDLPMLTEMDRVEWGGGTLIFTGWGIWSQKANLAGYQMVERIRSTFGELRPFHLATVNRFRQDELLLLTNFILAALVYGWDAYYVPNYEGCFVHVSHDEFCHIVTKRSEDFKQIIEPRLADPENGYRVLDESHFCKTFA